MSRIAVLAFSPIARDARVLRQIEYLSRSHHVVAIGYGHAHASFADSPNIEWWSLGPAPDERARANGVRAVVLRVSGRAKRSVRFAVLGFGGWALPRLYEWFYWRRPERRLAMEAIAEHRADAIHANDWDALPIAVRSARATGARVVFDCHEYAPGQHEDQRGWWLVNGPQRRYILRRYARSADAVLTVSKPIADRLAIEFEVQPVVILNAPRRGARRAHTRDPSRIRLIHHGVANRGRQLERMIQAVSLADERYTLDLMLVGDERYLSELRDLANDVATDRVFIREPIAPEEIVAELMNYDAGMFILPPNTFNHRAALPNKLFDFLCAGLAVVIGPSEAMRQIVQEHSCGLVAPSFEPGDVAHMLRSLTHEQLLRMQDRSWEASERLNADHEMGKVLDLYDQLLDTADV